MSFWDVVWFIFISFAFVAYLMVLFSILSDLFRDRETSGWVKAVWIVALIFLPLLTSLIYLIARGSGMAERSWKSAEAMRQQQDAYIREVAGKVEPGRPDRPGPGDARLRRHHADRVRRAEGQGAGLTAARGAEARFIRQG